MRVGTSVITMLCLAALAAAGSDGLQAQSGMYSKTVEIPIGGAAAFDYLYADSSGKRLYVSHGAEVVVIDTGTNTVVGKVTDTPGVHGIAIAPNGKGFTTNGRENKVSVFDVKTLQTLSKVDTGGNPDAVTYEPKQKEVYAFNHNATSSATVIDADKGTVVATVQLSGANAESGQADPALGRVFVNIESNSTVDAIDIATHKVVATWPVAPASGPTGMAIDPVTHRIFVGGGPSMVMMDATNGKVIASAPICSGTDATWYDPGTKMAFSSCGGTGSITAVKVDGDKLTVVQTIETERAARTMAGDAVTHKLYIVAAKPDPNPPPAAPGARGRGAAVLPDSFHASVFEMKK